MKIWQVRWATELSLHDHTELFLTKESASAYYASKEPIATDILMSEVEDIWQYTERNFETKLDFIMNEREKNGSFDYYGRGETPSFWLELEGLFKEMFFEEYSFKIVPVFEGFDFSLFVLSAVWVFNGEFYHYVREFEVR